VANTPWARALGVAAATAGVAFSTTAMPSQGAHFLHLITYAIWLGTNVWNSFFVGLTMFKNMPRQTFGRVQSKLFPMYFALTTGCNLVLLGSLYLAQGGLAAAPSNAVTTLLPLMHTIINPTLSSQQYTALYHCACSYPAT